jgi:hypothetical protein
MINTIEFVTTSGVKAVIKERLTFGEKRRVQKILMSKITVDTITKEGATSVKKATADIALEYQDAMTEVALVSTEVDGKVKDENPYYDMMSWEGEREKDAQEIINKISEIHTTTETKQEGEKKEAGSV